MEISYEDERNEGCFKVSHKIYGNLNAKHNETSAVTVLWNIYQIFVYDDFTFNCPKVFIPEFNISNLIICSNYLVCLDDNGNIHLTPVKCKHSSQKRLKSSFQPREQGVKCIENFYDNTISIKYMSENFYLCVYKVSADFILETKHSIIFDKLSLSNPESKMWIFHTYSVNSSEYDEIKDYYKQKEIWKDHVIIIFSLDNKNVYSILYSSKTCCETLIPTKLYTSLSEIADVYILKTNNISAVICLSIGTVIQISLDHHKNDMKVVHLNTAIDKLVHSKDFMVYTDGNTMWKSENTFTESVKFKKCLITQVKDFVIIQDKLLCTTFSNLIYMVNINDDLFKEIPQNKYYPASEVLNNDNCLVKIMSEIAKSNEIVKNIKEEEKYITILSLSNRYDILDDVICYKVTVFESFDDVAKEGLTLVENIQNYYIKDTFCFLINLDIKTNVNKFTEMLSSIFGNLMIHVTFSTPTSTIKSLSIIIEGQFKNVNLAVPVFTCNSDLYKITIDIKLITSISQVFKETHDMWTVLHSRKFNFNSEYFIKTKVQAEKNYSAVEEEFVDPIYQSAVCHFRHLYKFSRNTTKIKEWVLYAKLPDKYQEIINNRNYLHTPFSIRKAEVLLRDITSDEFIKSKSAVAFVIGNDKVNLEIINDGFTKPMLKVRCTNLEKAHHIRNFLSQLVNNNFSEFEPSKEFVDHGLYSTIEKFQKIFQETNNEPYTNFEFMQIFEKYQKSITGKIPI